MLGPGWKAKFAIQVFAAGFEILAAIGVWGHDRTFDFVRRLSENAGGLIRCGAEVERVATDEYAALAMDCISGNTITWQARGAPVKEVIPRDAAEMHYYYLRVPMNATYPSFASSCSRTPARR